MGKIMKEREKRWWH